MLRVILFIVLGVLACVEKLAATANTVAVERDWVSPVLFCFVQRNSLLNLSR
jgi:hypothetical protein